MSRSDFSLTEQQVDDRTQEIRIEGELDLAVADQLDQLLERITAERILVDLADCAFLDSTGIAVVLRADAAARTRGARVAMHSAQEQVQRVLFVTGLTETDLVFATRADALAEQAPL